MTFTQPCPRCGYVFAGEDPDTIADEMVEHAHVEHGHSVTHEHARAHLDGDASDHAAH
jgi:predicted small metal-binding protein